MKKIFIFIAALALFVGMATAQGEYTIIINGELVEFSNSIQNIDGRTYAPARQYAEYFGARVAWHSDLAAVGITVEDDEWVLFTRETLAYRNGRRYDQEVKAQLVDGLSMLPVRFIGEMLGKDVIFEAETKTIRIDDKKVPEPITEKDLYDLRIMGESIATAEQMAAFLLRNNPTPLIEVSALELAQIFLEEGAAEGVRGDYAFAQSIHETGFFRFRRDVSAHQNNFCGLGATGGGVPGNSFPDARTGARAQIQHLKWYATKEPTTNQNIDPRWVEGSVARGSAPTLIGLAQALNPSGLGWAYPGYPNWKYDSVKEAYDAGETYGQLVHKIFLRIMEE